MNRLQAASGALYEALILRTLGASSGSVKCHGVVGMRLRDGLLLPVGVVLERMDISLEEVIG